jgi:hypothetical protein
MHRGFALREKVIEINFPEALVKLVILILATLGFAAGANAATCPAQSKTVYSCKNAPQKGDSLVLSKMVDSIEVCQRGRAFLWVIEMDGKSEFAKAKVIRRDSEVIYKYVEGQSSTTLSIPRSSTPSEKSISSVLSLELAESNIPKLSTTFVCEAK